MERVEDSRSSVMDSNGETEDSNNDLELAQEAGGESSRLRKGVLLGRRKAG